MAKKKKRRTRSPHPGVTLKSRLLPSGARRHFARFIDPDTGRETDVTLSPVALSTATARTHWAKQKSKAIERRKMELEAGAPLIVRKPTLGEKGAIAEWTASLQHNRMDRTQETHADRIERFERWAERNGVTCVSEITAPKLAAFRQYVVALPRKNVKRGGARGERVSSGRARAPRTINGDLTVAQTMLNAWRKLGYVRLSRDEIAEALEKEEVPKTLPRFLLPADIQRLLRAAMRHDAETFTATRMDIAKGRLHATYQYEPIAPFVAVVLLGGFRQKEARLLRWDQVDLTAIDHHGAATGTIRMTGKKRERLVRLGITPTLRTLLAAMKLRAGNETLVFPQLSEDIIEDARGRLTGTASEATPRKPTKGKPRPRKKVESYGAPPFDWQMLRSTCSTYLVNAPSIFGDASIVMASRRLGHRGDTALRHYVGLYDGVPFEARTLEAAMRVEDEMRELIARVGGDREASFSLRKMTQ